MQYEVYDGMTKRLATGDRVEADMEALRIARRTGEAVVKRGIEPSLTIFCHVPTDDEDT